MKDKMEQPEYTPEQLAELEDMQEEQADETQTDQYDNSQEFAEAYGSPEPEEKHNQHTFLSNAVNALDTVKTTYLDEWELGRPMFSVRFLLDMEDISEYYLGELSKKYEMPNRVADYFLQKTYNITNSGMSKGGFAMNLNVTKKMDVVRRKIRGNIENLKGGKKK